MVQQFHVCEYNQKKKKMKQNQKTPQIQKDMCTSMFKAALFKLPRHGSNPSVH